MFVRGHPDRCILVARLPSSSSSSSRGGAARAAATVPAFPPCRAAWSPHPRAWDPLALIHHPPPPPPLVRAGVPRVWGLAAGGRRESAGRRRGVARPPRVAGFLSFKTTLSNALCVVNKRKHTKKKTRHHKHQGGKGAWAESRAREKRFSHSSPGRFGASPNEMAAEPEFTEQLTLVSSWCVQCTA